MIYIRYVWGPSGPLGSHEVFVSFSARLTHSTPTEGGRYVHSHSLHYVTLIASAFGLVWPRGELRFAPLTPTRCARSASLRFVRYRSLHSAPNPRHSHPNLDHTLMGVENSVLIRGWAGYGDVGALGVSRLILPIPEDSSLTFGSVLALTPFVWR